MYACTPASCSSAPLMWTLKLASPVLPAASVARQITAVSPIANVDSEAGEHVGSSSRLMMSIAEAANSRTAPLGETASATKSPGVVTVGGVVSTTVTVKLFVVRSPFESVVERRPRCCYSTASCCRSRAAS
jgi:hypothetical protein